MKLINFIFYFVIYLNIHLEIIEYKFVEEDKFLILASDGVWEFIESPEVKIN